MIFLAEALFGLGALLYFPAYVWAFVLAWRANGAWFLGMLFFGYALYPFLAYQRWDLMRRNAYFFGGGFACMAVGLLVMLVAG